MPVGIQSNHADKRFGRLRVLSFEGRAKNYVALWRCLCDCGQEILARGPNLASGNTTSCGCVHGVNISNPVSHEQLLQLVVYFPLTGQFLAARDWRGRKQGERVGSLDIDSGYR